MNRFEVRWSNFRGFADTGWLSIKPVTVLIGSNNTGKTSVIAPLLLLKQTLESDDLALPLITRGALFNAGRYADLVHTHDPKRQVKLAVGFHTHGQPKRKPKAVGDYPPGVLELALAAGDDPEAVLLASYRVLDVYKRQMVVRARRPNGKYSLRGMSKMLNRETKSPGSRTSQAGSVDRRIRRAIRESRPRNFLFRTTSLLRAALPKPSAARDSEIEFSAFTSLYLSIIETVNSQIAGTLDGLSYVGPLRHRPQRFYEVSGEPPSNVGVQGQFAPELLYRNQRKELFEKVNKWISAFDGGTSLACASVGEAIGAFSLMLKRPDRAEINLADAGFGISQVLPLIVQGQLGDPRGVLISEQPEIHLNPRLQALLADLFVDIAAAGKGVVVETHSEHLLLRLRRLVADGSIPAEDVAIYYVERGELGSAVRPIPLLQNGHIPAEHWPRGFFEDSLRESLGLATAQQKRLR